MSIRWGVVSMINRASNTILQYLLRKGVINDSSDVKEYYKYGIELTISSLLNIILIMGIGILFCSIIESIIFLVCFILIRQFTGGFHANTYFKCNFSFCLAFTVVLIMYYITLGHIHLWVSGLISILCVAIIVFHCPIEHINKPIPKHKRKIHKIAATILGISYGIIGTILIAISNKYGVLVLYTLVLVTVLIIFAIAKDRRCKYAEEQ